MQRYAQKNSTNSMTSRARDRGIEDGPRLRSLGGCFCGECIIIVFWRRTAPSPLPLLPPQGQQSCVGGEDLGHSLFELPARLHQPLNLLDPFMGDALDALLTPGHKGERPDGVPLLVLRAMAGGLTTAAVSERKRTGKQIGRDGEAAEEFELALAETSSLGTFGCDMKNAPVG